MNSYNENLHSSIVSSLDSQRLELQKTRASLDASKFSLYYAQGDKITAAEKLKTDTKKYKHQEKVYEEAVKNDNFSTNVVTIANSGKNQVATSVNNTSVAAANVQIATNAIVKLASDMGAINTIINAADYNTDLYNLSEKANDYMGATAYLAEKTSQYGMEASAQVAAVSAPSLANIATETDTRIKQLLEISKTDFDNMTEIINKDNKDLAASNTAEKAAEGVLADSYVNFKAASSAYVKNNEVLNLDLQVKVNKYSSDQNTPIEQGSDPSASTTKNASMKAPTNSADYEPLTPNYQVNFTQYTAPDFKNIQKKNEPEQEPVSTYYLMLVDYNRSKNFNISDAETIQAKDLKDGAFYYEFSKKETEDGSIQSPIFNRSSLLDDEGKEMQLGENYVIFIYAVFDNDYKKAINTYDDYLSAPSKYFCLTEDLVAPGAKDIQHFDVGDTVPLDSTDISVENTDDQTGAQSDTKSKYMLKAITNDNKVTALAYDKIEENKTPSEDTYTSVYTNNGDAKQLIVFPIDALKVGGEDLEYRCMFLPYDPKITDGLMTSTELKALQLQTRILEEIVKEYEKLIDKEKRNRANKTITWKEAKKSLDLAQGQANEIEEKIEELLGLLEQVEKDLSVTGLLPSDKRKLNAEKKELKAAITSLESDLQAPQADIDKYQGQMDTIQAEINACDQLIDNINMVKESAIEALKPKMNEKPGFFFDRIIAARVTAANYTVAKINSVDPEGNYNFGIVPIEENTTDNFGNRLIQNSKYIPVIFVVTKDTSQSVTQEFKTALSVIKFTKQFKFKG